MFQAVECTRIPALAAAYSQYVTAIAARALEVNDYAEIRVDDSVTLRVHSSGKGLGFRPFLTNTRSRTQAEAFAKDWQEMMESGRKTRTLGSTIATALPGSSSL